jgi:hypothetical protein
MDLIWLATVISARSSQAHRKYVPSQAGTGKTIRDLLIRLQ